MEYLRVASGDGGGVLCPARRPHILGRMGRASEGSKICILKTLEGSIPRGLFVSSRRHCVWHQNTGEHSETVCE